MAQTEQAWPQVKLSCADAIIDADDSLIALSRERVFAERFADQGNTSPLLTVRRVEKLDGQVLEGPMGRAVISLEHDVLRIEIADGVFTAELALRVAWYIATSRLGGILVHAACLRHGDAAIVASGKSGDGKSTLSRLCRGAGLTLMSDEIVQLFPDGRVGGTPFRSDADNAGSPGLAKARYLFALEKAASEELKPLAPAAAGQLLLSQAFDVEVVRMAAAQRASRLLSFLANVELRTLAFRKEPVVGDFVRALLEG